MNTHKYKQLSLEQRSQLQLLLKMGISKKKLAEELGVHRSTVYRELKRNAKKDGGYSARYAEGLYQGKNVLDENDDGQRPCESLWMKS